MTIAGQIQGTAQRAARRCGGGNQVTIRRSGDAIVHGLTGQAITSLAVSGTVALGGSSLDLDGASIRAGSVLGQGWKFTLAGHTAPYEVQADVEVTASSNTFESVSISPVLSHEATDDAAATITQQYGEWTFDAFRRQFSIDEITSDFEAEDYILVVSVLGAAFLDFELTDTVTWDSKARSVVRRMPFKPGDDLGCMRLHCRG